MADLLQRLSILRVASNEVDRKKVLSIRKPEDVYKGSDYLPCTYIQMMNSSNCQGFVAALDGERFIAFVIVNILDEGQTYILRAMRISKEFEGQGVIRWFLGKIENIIKTTSSVRFTVSTTVREDKDAVRRENEGKCYRIVDKDMLDFKTTKDVYLSKEHPHKDLESLQVISPENLTDLLESRGRVNALFGKRILVYGVPFRPIKSNVPYILQETSLILGCNIDDEEKMLFTFGFVFDSLIGTMISIDIYGFVKENLKAHIEKHVHHALPRGRDAIILRLYFDKNVSHDFMNKIFKEMGFSVKPLSVSGCISFETKL